MLFRVRDEDGVWGDVNGRNEEEVRQYLDEHDVVPVGSLLPVYEVEEIDEDS